MWSRRGPDVVQMLSSGGPDVVLLWSRRGLDVVLRGSRCGPQGFQMCLDETGEEFERDRAKGLGFGG